MLIKSFSNTFIYLICFRSIGERYQQCFTECNNMKLVGISNRKPILSNGLCFCAATDEMPPKSYTLTEVSGISVGEIGCDIFNASCIKSPVSFDQLYRHENITDIDIEPREITKDTLYTNLKGVYVPGKLCFLYLQVRSYIQKPLRKILRNIKFHISHYISKYEMNTGT